MVEKMDIEQFLNPGLLWLLLALPLMIAYYVFRTRQGRASIRISTISGVEGVPRSAKYYLRHIPFVLRCMAVALIIVALARPQNSSTDSSSTTEGIDIVLSIDISGSMLARDFQPDRITAAKEMAANFVMGRPNDRIGLVVFASGSFTQSPLTTDKATLLTLLGGVRTGMMEDGTAIGSGLATAVNRLKESEAKSKVIILLTDGINNRGQISPLTAAELAKTYGIRVYTIGVGTQGMAPYPMIDMWGNLVFEPQQVEIDEEILQDIAENTDGSYFRATDNKQLRDVYEQIDKLERSKVDVENFTYYNELFVPLVLLALLLLVAEALFQRLYLRQIP